METALCWLLCAKISIQQPKHEVKNDVPVHQVQEAKPTTSKPRANRTLVASKRTISTDGGSTVVDLINKYFPAEAEAATAIAKCESGLRSNALGTNTNGTQDHGVFQINSVHFGKIKADNKKEWLMNPENNIKLARQIYDRQGWSPWVCKKVLAMK